MNKRKQFLPVLLTGLLVILLINGCTGKKAENKATAEPVKTAPAVIGTETSLLLKDLVENGDYVNSKEFPSIIKASIVHESLGQNIHIIDLRPAEIFSAGHIKSAVNKKFEDLPGYFETGIKPFEYDKIILVCADGQVSCYTASLLHLMGYGNVYAMRWGMSAWNRDYARNEWLKGITGDYESKLVRETTERPSAKGMPDLKTGMGNGAEIGAARFRKLFEEGTADILIEAEEVFSNPANYFVINLERKDKYDDGHIPGAIRYKPEATLGFTDEMATIPQDKTVVVYCATGHNSGFASAYLRLFGYDARTLKYGNNGFMYNKMVSERTKLSWLPFTESDINNFETVK
jgi:rhodanese-related sulfurtransferase